MSSKMGRFAQEWSYYGALRARTVSTMLALRARMVGKITHHSHKFFRPFLRGCPLRSSFNEWFFRPFLREAPHNLTILTRSAPFVWPFLREAPHGLLFGKLRQLVYYVFSDIHFHKSFFKLSWFFTFYFGRMIIWLVMVHKQYYVIKNTHTIILT